VRRPAQERRLTAPVGTPAEGAAKRRTTPRVHNAALYVDSDARPGWIPGDERTPSVGEEVYCAVGAGEVTAVRGRTSDGSRLLEIRVATPGAAPFFAAASNVLVAPEPTPFDRG